jgi:serine/threonine protein kinase
MEYVEGRSLGKILSKVTRLPEGSAVRIVNQAAQGLHYAHKRRVIHRDVKPDNILVRPDGLAKLADFGLAKDFDDVGGGGLTRSAAALGTPHFMAPEQYADAKRAGVASDVYALGATLFMAVTGKPPFAGCGSLIALAKKARGDVPSPRELVPGLSEQIEAAIRKAMSPDPTKRPASCLEFVKLLPSPGLWDKDPAPGAAAPAGKQRSGKERRASVRRVCTVAATCVVDTDLFNGGGADAKEAWPAVVRDVSAGGLGVVLARRFEPGTLLAVEMEGGPRKKVRTMLVRVVRVQGEELGHWRHGCAFVTPPDDNDLGQLLREAR